ncbi:hypothetical protein HY29_08560 [Hyphomonas beringensis]|uniref:Uncharacterized protein n=1 Tax=Hyphomonas beringensis TaxID=1280946 RepID=A0A062UF34_9PROT|nr:hypothetical protein HY29_08560 [Hyphomonas beringensis]
MDPTLSPSERKKAVRNAGIALFAIILPWILLGLTFMVLFVLSSAHHIFGL